MKSLKIIFSVLILLSTTVSLAWVSNYVNVVGTIRSFDSSKVEVEDSLKNRLIIPREAVAKTYKLQTGQKTSIPVNVQSFSQIKTIPSVSQRELQVKSEQAFAKIEKSIAESKKRGEY